MNSLNSAYYKNNNFISETEYTQLRPHGSNSPATRFYGLPKIHKNNMLMFPIGIGELSGHPPHHFAMRMSEANDTPFLLFIYECSIIVLSFTVYFRSKS